MEKQKKVNSDNEEFKDTDQGFNARNQYSGSGDFSPDEQEKPNENDQETLKSSLNTNDEPESPTDLQQDESGTLKSNN
ncbi:MULTISPECIES: hypothetical protein [unclassified Flavobacterium]|uniref:hypothetical protein n=1 Tax=unclassified Flavobacterium TaxID=196869 RepID=UPI00105FE1CC|nr:MULTISPECIES: hypothetical protein [unclassified Flavobacterium]TDP00252.1 hypothetical protein EV145_106141 [Flavobacterium sp. 245]TDW52141.1 hypothetical protein EV144_101825 [Flavobacterium sp. 270]